jgi:hypothetical protein
MATGIIQNSTSVAANTQLDDALINNILAFNRQGLSRVDYAIVASATGLLVTVFVGTVMVAPEFAPSLANRFPIFPDDFNGVFGVLPADRILLRIRNTTGGALTGFFTFKLTNVGG